MKKNFLITTGGSGGHVIPATIFYDHLSKEANITLTIDKRGLKYLDKKNFNFKIINTPRLGNIFLFPINLILVLFLILKSLVLLKSKKIEKIFSTGGYMSLPIILAARLLRLEVYLIEPNQVLGRANKYFLNSCTKIFCYSKEILNFPQKFRDKMIIIYPLVKESIYKLKSHNNTKDTFSLLVVGGSQGANIFDKNLKNSIVNVAKKKPIKVMQQTNKKNISNLREFYLSSNVENNIFDFDNNFVGLLQEADLCITRAGASTLAELSVSNTPFIAVPLPTSKDNHQFENAHFYKRNNCCWIIEQNNFEKKIEDLLIEIIINKLDYLKKKENLEKLNYQNNWYNVNQKIIKTINEN